MKKKSSVARIRKKLLQNALLIIVRDNAHTKLSIQTSRTFFPGSVFKYSLVFGKEINYRNGENNGDGLQDTHFREKGGKFFSPNN